MSALYSFGMRATEEESATQWIVKPTGDTTWLNGSQAARRLHEDAEGLFTYESAPDYRQRETFLGEVPT